MPTAVITGASTGIGRDLAVLCGKAGYDLAVVARTRKPLEDLAAETGRRVTVIALDLSKPGAPGELFDALRGEDVEILINNAAFGLRGFFHELDTGEQMQMVELNITALTHLTRLFLPGMVARGKGYVMNVASTAAFQPGPLMAVYYASKAYVLSLSEALYNELKGTGVSVTTLCPGPTATEFQKRAKMENTAMVKSGPMMASSTVARLGFAGMLNRKPVVVTGAINSTLAFLTRFAPRQMAASIARKLQE